MGWWGNVTYDYYSYFFQYLFIYLWERWRFAPRWEAPRMASHGILFALERARRSHSDVRRGCRGGQGENVKRARKQQAHLNQSYIYIYWSSLSHPSIQRRIVFWHDDDDYDDDDDGRACRKP